jgi:transposase
MPAAEVARSYGAPAASPHPSRERTPDVSIGTLRGYFCKPLPHAETWGFFGGFPKRGRKRLFNPEIYKHRFSAERTFAWIDKFKALLVRFERKDAYFFGLHCLAFALINLRDLVS